MLTWAEIDRYKENNRLEAKRAAGGFPHSLWETYGAFANTLGGIILLGVEERADHTFQPVQLPAPQWLVDRFWQQVNDETVVSDNILELEQVQLVAVQGCEIVMIQVPRATGRQRPVFVGRDVYQGTYQRNGEGDYRCDRQQVEQMLRQREQSTFDMEVLQQENLAALEPECVRQYEQLLAERHPWWQAGEEPGLLQRAGVLALGDDGALHPTRAGLLLLGTLEAIRRNFPGYMLEYREHKAKGWGWQTVLTTADGHWKGNLWTFYGDMAAYVRQYVGTLSITGPEREAVCASVQEGLANGLIHANYEKGRGIVVSRRRRAIWIENPGDLPRTMDVGVAGGLAAPRNVLLAQLFHYMGVGRGIGGGLPGIAAVWKRQGWVLPRLEQNQMSGNAVLTLIFSNDDQEAVQEIQQALLLDYITGHITVNVPETAKLLQLPFSAARKLLRRLVEQQILERDGKNYRLKM